MLLLLACTTAPPKAEPIDYPLDLAVADRLDWEAMRDHTAFLTADELGGRIPGSPGSAIARDYLLGQMEEVGLEPVGTDGYSYAYANEPVAGRYMVDAEGLVVPHATTEGVDLVGLVPGTNLADEYIVLMAHYDHLGVEKDGEVFNGAFDDGAAVGMLLELARVLGEAPARRSVVFLFTDDEESGLDGARAWISATTVPREDIVFGLSADPLGRALLPDYGPIGLVGLERSPELQEAFRQTTIYADTDVVFIHRELIPVFASDQDTFYEQSVPAVWFVNMGFTWYHTTGDVEETIDYRVMLHNARYLAQLVHFFGNTEARWDYVGAPEIRGEHAQDVQALFHGVLASEYPNSIERSDAEDYLAELQKVVDADTLDAVDNPDAMTLGALYFLMFELSKKYPGEVPPPSP